MKILVSGISSVVSHSCLNLSSSELYLSFLLLGDSAVTGRGCSTYARPGISLGESAWQILFLEKVRDVVGGHEMDEA